MSKQNKKHKKNLVSIQPYIGYRWKMYNIIPFNFRKDVNLNALKFRM